jgi:dTDP-4-amino-4,6-dideoxygalactose transaminase
MKPLAILGAPPAFADGVPFVRAPTPPLERVMKLLQPSWDRGMLTNGPLVRALEEQTADLLGVEHVVAVSSCTTGLMLALQAVSSPGEVILPSFTFSASAHAVAWNGSAPRFCECDPRSFQLDVADAAGRAGRVDAILATHVFGAPCPVDEVESLATNLGVPVVFDAAHAFGALHSSVPVARFGDASVFSLTPTKPLVAGEGGLVASMRDDVAHHIRLGRDYGNPCDYDTRFAGLNGRMSEMHAAVALASLECFDELQRRRDAIVYTYRASLESVPGVRTQSIAVTNVSTWKDFTIAIDAERFGLERDALRCALTAEGIDTRCYFDPPVHRQRAYAADPLPELPVTDRVAASVLSLPIFPSLEADHVARIVEVIATVHERAEEVREEIAA